MEHQDKVLLTFEISVLCYNFIKIEIKQNFIWINLLVFEILIFQLKGLPQKPCIIHITKRIMQRFVASPSINFIGKWSIMSGSPGDVREEPVT